MFARIAGQRMYLWPAVNHEGDANQSQDERTQACKLLAQHHPDWEHVLEDR